jgi:hypothetical protein
MVDTLAAVEVEETVVAAVEVVEAAVASEEEVLETIKAVATIIVLNKTKINFTKDKALSMVVVNTDGRISIITIRGPP